jgi:heat shock protein HslJ
MAGPVAAMAQEQAFLAALGRVTTCVLDGRRATFLADEEVVARLSC